MQAQVPARPSPPRLVNDLAGIFTPVQQRLLEQELRRFDDSTSNQIAVVTLPSLDGYAPADMAYEIGKQWGVGQEEDDNGIVVLIKPKTDEESGEVFIAPGYGLEAVIPDAVCKRIIEEEMLPYFRDGQYFMGTKVAVGVLQCLAKGEISKDRYEESFDYVALIIAVSIFVLFLVLAILALRSGSGNDDGYSGGSDDSDDNDRWRRMFTFLALWTLFNNSNSSHSGSWGGFSNDDNDFGGYGGFGGGSFGGGGAGGSW